MLSLFSVLNKELATFGGSSNDIQLKLYSSNDPISNAYLIGQSNKAMYITSLCNLQTYVGIGTSNPQANLHVVGNIYASGSMYIGGDTPAFQTSLQVNPISQTFIVNSSTQKIFTITSTLNGMYQAIASNCAIYQNGIKLGYINSNQNDYTIAYSNTTLISINNSSNVQTTFTISLRNAALYGDVIDATIWPSLYSTQASVQTGVVYQVFCNIVWGLCNNNAILSGSTTSTTNVGIGTTNPQAALHVVGNIYASGSMYIGGDTPSFRTSLQVNPVNQAFIVSSSTQQTFTISSIMNGIYSVNSSNCAIYQNGIKLAYINSNQNDYTVTSSNTAVIVVGNSSNIQTTYSIRLRNAALYGDVVDATIWPSLYTTQASVQTGLVYQVFCNIVWGLCNNNAILTNNVTAVGIGTTNPQATLHVVGNIVATGGMYIGGDTPAFTTSLQVAPINQVYKISSSLQKSFTLSTLMNGIYGATESNCRIYQNGIKLAYINSSLNDYTVATSNTAIIYVNNSSNVTTSYTITLTNAAMYGDIIDITIWPTLFSNQAAINRGVVYQVFCNIVWGQSNNNAILSSPLVNVGIGTTSPQSNLHVVGNTLITGNTITNSLLVTSNVGIGTTSPQSNLDIWGNMSVTIGGQKQFAVSSNQVSIIYDTLTVPYVSSTTLVAANNVGIGTTQPSYSLHTIGNIYASDTIAAANPMMFRNRLYNGGMNIWQRGTTSTATAASKYTTADRWCGALLTTNLSLAQSTTVPAGQGFSYSLQVTTTTTNTASIPLIEQRIESSNILDLVSGTPVTVSFWASQTAGTLMSLQISLYVPTTSGNIFTAQSQTGSTVATPTLTSTLTYYTANFVLTTVGTLTTTLNAGLSLYFATGTTTSATTCTFLITGVQLEKGRTASPFEYRPYGVELQLCQRYYQKSYKYTDTPGTVNSTDGYIATSAVNVDAIAGTRYVVSMRATPSNAIYSTNGTFNTASVFAGGADTAAVTTIFATNVGITYINVTGLTQGNGYRYQYIADAEL